MNMNEIGNINDNFCNVCKTTVFKHTNVIPIWKYIIGISESDNKIYKIAIEGLSLNVSKQFRIKFHPDSAEGVEAYLHIGWNEFPKNNLLCVMHKKLLITYEQISHMRTIETICYENRHNILDTYLTEIGFLL